MFDASQLKSPADLPQPLPYREESGQPLKLGFRRPFDFEFNWLRQPSGGVLEGDFGLLIRAAGEASAVWVLEGAFSRELSLDERGRLRVKVYRKTANSYAQAVQVRVMMEPVAALPDKPEELLAAILGTHAQQWLQYWSEKIRTAPGALAKLIPDCATEALQRFFEFWDGLDQYTAARIWEAAPDANAVTLAAGGAWKDETLLPVLARLKQYFAGMPLVREALERVRTLAEYRSLDEWLRSRIERLLGPVETEKDLLRLIERLTALGGLRDAVYQKALAALRTKYEAEAAWRLSAAGEHTAVVDCAFAFTARGLALFRRAWSGDFSWVAAAGGEDFELHSGVFSDQIARETRLELHLPFLDRKGWSDRLEALANAEVASDGDGRLLVYHVEASHRIEHKNAYQSILALAGSLRLGRRQSGTEFTLSYCDSRALRSPQDLLLLRPILESYSFDPAVAEALGRDGEPLNGEVHASLAISVPGSLAAAWLEAPEEKSPDFFPVYSRVSVAVQRCMRAWLPYCYFSEANRYGDLAAAFPLLVYQASLPFAGRPRYDFSYDVMSAESMEELYRSAARRLSRQLARIEQLLRDSGQAALAAFYSPRSARDILDSVRRQPKLLHALVAGDAFLTDAVINLGCHGAELRRILPANPSLAVRKLTEFAAEFVKAFHGRLRRLYGKRDFVALGSLLLVEATAALRGSALPDGSPQAVLRLSGAPAAEGATLLWVNSAWKKSVEG